MASLAGASSISIARSLKLKPQAPSSGFSSLSCVSLPISGKSSPILRMRQGASRFRVCCAAKTNTLIEVCEIVKEQLGLSPDTVVNGESKFVTLGADSLDTVEIVMLLEEKFGITMEEETAQSITTIQDAADMIEELVEKKA